MFTTNRPTVVDFLDAYRGAVRGTKDERADFVEGSLYEQIGGVSAIIWSRLAQRDENLIDDTQTNSATGDALTERARRIFDTERYLDAPGEGTITVSRPSSGTADTFWKGTRVEVVDRTGMSASAEFEITSDVPVAATAIRVQLPIRATSVRTAMSVRFDDPIYPRFADSIWDATWKIQQLDCSAGSTFESAPALRARSKLSRKNRRLGLVRSLIDACDAVGAHQVVVFPSNFGGDDIDGGLNWIYVGDGNFNAGPTLVKDCILALEKVRSLGDNLQVGPMVNTNLLVNATVYLNQPPATINQIALLQRLKNYVVAALKQDYTYSLDSFRAALYQASSLVQDVTFNTPTTDATLLTTSYGILNFPASLTRYQLLPDNVTLTLKGPNV